MPLFDYRCTVCGKVEEVLQKCVKDGEVFCWECNKPMMRMVSGSNFQLKGSGWAKDNYGASPT